MWSSLRPTGRRVSSNHADQLPTNRSKEEQSGYRPASSEALPDEEKIYKSIVSATAPVLPPIPRVASIYGAPSKLPSFDYEESKITKSELAEKAKTEVRLAGTSLNAAIPAVEQIPADESRRSRSGGRNNFSRPFPSASSSNFSNPPQRAAPEVPLENPTRKPQPDRSFTDSVQLPTQGNNHLAPQSRRPPEQRTIVPTLLNLEGNTRPKDESVVPWEFQGEAKQQQPPSRPLQLPLAEENLPPDSRPRPSLSRTAQSYPQLSVHPSSQRPNSSEKKSSSDSQQQTGIPELSSVAPQNEQQQPMQMPAPSINQQRSSKQMLTRLNPMSLLARRRSSQPASESENDPYRRNILLGSRLPDDYDFRIRGNKVHDFSTPRTRHIPPPLDLKSSAFKRTDRRSASSGDQIAQPVQSHEDRPDLGQRRESDRQRTPIFKEHFEDNIDTWRFNQDDRRNQSTTGILDRMPADIDEKQLAPLPPFAQKFPEVVRDPLLLSDPTFAVAPQSAELSPSTSSSYYSEELSPVPESPSIESPSVEKSESVARQSLQATPPKNRSRAPSMQSTNSPQRSLSKHLQPNPSRFSFDMSGVGSAVQEKLLEDKHRQKAAQRARMSKSSQISVAATDEDFDSDDVDFGEGLDEEIPGLDEDEDEFPMASAIANFTLESMENGSTAESKDLGRSKPSTGLSTAGQLYTHANINLGDNVPNAPDPEPRNPWTQRQIISTTDDDLYFDDGVIEDVDLQPGTPFDESVFDDESSRVYGRPIRDLDPEPLSTVHEAESAEDSSHPSTRPISLESSLAAGQNLGATADTSRTSVQPPDKGPAARRGSALKQDLSLSGLDDATGLTKDNLAAYHDALALATQKAAQEGRFERKMSMDEGGAKAINSHSNHVSFQDQLPIRGVNGLGPPSDAGLEDYEQDEDDIIAAANAEALENDEEGFYGREFGFYARANGSEEVEFVNGGYFGAGMSDIKRSHSGRVNGQEPSLTPITERSEWSQRNSMISLAIHSGHGSMQPAVQTPGLAQIADSLRDGEEDDDMTLSELIKLRKSAWGGSSNSLHSNGGSENKSGKSASASPPKFDVLSMPPPPRPAPPPPTKQDNAMVKTQDVTMNHPVFPPTSSNNNIISGADPSPPAVVQTTSSPIRRSHAIKGGAHGHAGSPVKSHSRNSSGADSVTYVKEKDEAEGSFRWVMERRKTVEGGQVELLGREVVEGGKI